MASTLAMRRRRRSRGRWMKLHDPALLAAYMRDRDFTQARLARFAGCSRQFINQLINGQRSTCTPAVGCRIEEALQVLPRTLFLPRESPTARPHVTRHKTTVGAA